MGSHPAPTPLQRMAAGSLRTTRGVRNVITENIATISITLALRMKTAGWVLCEVYSEHIFIFA